MSQTLSDRASRRGSDRRRASFTWVTAACISAAALLGVASRVLAFSNPQDFGKYVTPDVTSVGVGGGRYYTGSPADAYSCEVCHSHPSNYSFPLVQKGLPLDGYFPNTKYRIELSSPAASAAWTQATNQGLNPVTTLNAEFIAESGKAAGTISFASESDTSPVAFPSLWCPGIANAKSEKQKADEYGMFVYSQEIGSLPTEMTIANGAEVGEKCTIGRGKDETGEEYERRCIVTLRPCGAQSVKFIWTAPDEWVGPIWFSAGFVTTYDRSSAPNDSDFVTLMSVPLNPGYAGATHETVLDSGCSVAGPGLSGSQSDVSRGVSLAVAWLLGLLFVRSRQRRTSGSQSHAHACVSATLLSLLACLGCSEGKGLVTDVSGAVGAYEASTCTKKCTAPLRCRDTAWPDAGTPESAAMAAMAAGNMKTSAVTGGNPLEMAAGGGAAGGDPTAMKVPSLGTVSLQFTSAQPPGVVSDWVRKCTMPDCTPFYIAVWIETEEDGERKYVQTLHDQKGNYIALSITNYLGLGSDCQWPKETETADAISTATLFMHKPFNLTWDGLYGNGHLAAKPGLYHIRIEVAIDETHHIEVADLPFMFGGPAPLTMSYDPAPAHAGATVAYTPTTTTP